MRTLLSSWRACLVICAIFTFAVIAVDAEERVTDRHKHHQRQHNKSLRPNSNRRNRRRRLHGSGGGGSSQPAMEIQHHGKEATKENSRRKITRRMKYGQKTMSQHRQMASVANNRILKQKRVGLIKSAKMGNIFGMKEKESKKMSRKSSKCKGKCSTLSPTFEYAQTFSPTPSTTMSPTSTTASPTRTPTTSFPTLIPTNGPTTRMPSTSLPTTTISTPTTKAPSPLPTILPTAQPTATPFPSPFPSAVPSESPTISEVPSLSLVPTVFVPAEVLFPANSFPAINGQVRNLKPQNGASNPRNVVCGAIQAVLTHPSNVDICFAASVNGGVWRTTSCTAAVPNWVPLTDSEVSQSVADMSYDESDASGNTILVGMGARSSFSQAGAPGVGMLYTTNALDATPTWRLLDNANGTINFRSSGIQFSSVFVRGSLMMAAAYDADAIQCARVGVFRSVDNGVTWTQVVRGVARALASDPNDPDRFYATVDFYGACQGLGREENGVYTSSDGGVTWAATNLAPASGIAEDELNNAKLSVSADNSRVWSALLRNGQASSISYSDNQGGSWVIMDEILTPNGDSIDGLNPREKPGGQGSIHFSLLASQTSKDLVYVGGDRQNWICDSGACSFPNFIGAIDFTGNLHRGNASVSASRSAPSPQWDHLTDISIAAVPGGGTATGTAPHADARDMKFRIDGSILAGDDGGIALRTNPSDNSGDWFSLCGNMVVFESHSVAYEPVLRTVIMGNQDNANLIGTLGQPNTFTILGGGDGNSVLIDFTSSEDLIFIYYGSQFLRSFFRLDVSKTTGEAVASLPISLEGVGDFVTVVAMNEADQRQIAVAVRLANSTGGADSITFVQTTIDRGVTWSALQSVGATSQITGLRWSPDGAFLYIVDRLGSVLRCTETNSLSCEARGGIFNSGHVFRKMAINPSNNEVLYMMGTLDVYDFRSPAVFVSTTGGVAWIDISVPKSLLDTAAMGAAVSYIQNDNADTVVVGTSNGLLVPEGGIGIGWRLLTTGLPTVTVMDMVYVEEDDTLVFSTLGRGVFLLRDASLVVRGEISAPLIVNDEQEPGYSGPTINTASIQDVLRTSNRIPP